MPLASVGVVVDDGICNGLHCFTPLEQSGDMRVAHHLLVSVLRLFDNPQRDSA